MKETKEQTIKKLVIIDGNPDFVPQYGTSAKYF